MFGRAKQHGLNSKCMAVALKDKTVQKRIWNIFDWLTWTFRFNFKMYATERFELMRNMHNFNVCNAAVMRFCSCHKDSIITQNASGQRKYVRAQVVQNENLSLASRAVDSINSNWKVYQSNDLKLKELI